MSHFIVLVALPGSLAIDEISAAVDKALAPFHEFECTGRNDQYVQNVDKLAEAREEFEKATCFTVVRPDGTRVYPFNEEGNYNEEFAPFYDKATRDLKLPEGYTSDHDALSKDFRTLAQWASGWYGVTPVAVGEEPDLEGDHKYGYLRFNEAGEVIELINRTNPNKKWDWCVVGGRWSGYFRAKPGTGGVKGEQGLMGSEKDAAGVDVIRKGDIDFEAEAAKITAEVMAQWDKAGVRTPFAFLDKNGAWHQKGRMGWFATVSDENHDWPGDFAKEFAKLDDQDWLVAVDCHI